MENKVTLFLLSDITYFEKDKRSVFIYTLADTYKSLLKTQNILDKLPDYFIQIHASYIVKIPNISKDFDAKNSNYFAKWNRGTFTPN